MTEEQTGWGDRISSEHDKGGFISTHTIIDTDFVISGEVTIGEVTIGGFTGA